MNDPHVEALLYKLETGPSVTYEAEPKSWERDAFSLHLEDGHLTVSMKEHHATEETARGRVEPLLRAWEIDTALRRGLGELRFRFERPKIIDRNPPPPGAGATIMADSGVHP